jgi:hypothetical protein
VLGTLTSGQVLVASTLASVARTVTIVAPPI